MSIRAIFFDMGGTIETFWYTRESRLDATAAFQKKLISAGIDLHVTNEQLYQIVVGGLEEYKRWCIQSMDELPPKRVWSEYIFKNYDLNQAKLAGIAEELSLFVEAHYFHREMRPEIPEVLEAIQKMDLKIGLISNVNSRGLGPTNLKSYGILDYLEPRVLSN